MIFWIWAAVFVGVVVLYLRHLNSRFSKYGVNYASPFASMVVMLKIMFRLEHITKFFETFSEDRFVGSYTIIKPEVTVTDLELLKKIAIKDSEIFLDRPDLIDEDSDPLFGRNLFSLKGQEWKDMRPALSPAFTSSKIRHMVPFMVEVGDQMIKVLKNKIRDSEDDYIDIEAKNLSSRYANDVIATCAFGLTVDSQSDENNEFFKMGKAATTFKLRDMFIFMLQTAVPKLMKMLNVSLFSEPVKAFFKDIVLNTMRDREERNVIRPDMIHLLMELKKGRLTHEDKTTADLDAGFATVEESAVGKKKINRVWSDLDLVAQAAIFFVAGFDTVSTAMSFAIYELAVNPEVQERLVREIRENEEKNGGKFDYNSVQRMTYMDMVISEVLRLWPPAFVLSRVCSTDYNMGRANKNASKDFTIRKGETVYIPLWTLHRNPKYFPDPRKFDPERFSEENKHNIKPFTYMPFGLGPRNCIGSRFALCEMKVMLYVLLKNMELSPCAETKIPPVLSKENATMMIEGGHWVRMKERKLS